MGKKSILSEIKTINGIFKMNLKVPTYQRAYKWTLKNVNQLIDDILTFKDKKAYRIGTIVVHKDKNDFFIVDGQQRITTLILILKALEKSEKLEEYKKEFNDDGIGLANLHFSNNISIKNLKQNYQEIVKRVKEFDTKIINFLLNSCEVVYVELNDISEAFQFFDSQNARGKDLAPHDLLKAFHLREMQDIDEKTKTKLIEDWERLDEEGKLSTLFNNYLFRIRNWSRGESARYFTKNDVDIFKGFSITKNTKELPPYALLYQMASVYVDNYNSHSSRMIDFNTLSFPFNLDLPIINGRRFFEMISHYHNHIKQIEESFVENKTIKILNNYKGKHRTGDKYIRVLFDCALIYYIDKFGDKEINKVIDKLFIWAYKLRLELKAVQLASIDNRALYTDVFKIIKNANRYIDVVNIHINNLTEIRYKNIDEKIKDRFKELEYYHE